MSRIRNKDTKPEVTVRKYLFSSGLRYRKNVRTLPGCPDIVLQKYNTAVFVNGCFWHVHSGCAKSVWPKSNTDYWKNKLVSNMERDRNSTRKLSKLGYNVIVVWECQLNKKCREKTLTALTEKIKVRISL